MWGYIDAHNYTYGYESQMIHVDALEEDVTSTPGIHGFVRINHERTTINGHDAYETFGVAAMAETTTRVLIRRVKFVQRSEQSDLVDVRTCWFAATPGWMVRMLTDSNEVLATFDFESGPQFPDSWISHYRRYDVDGEGSEFLVYRLRPRRPVGDLDFYRVDWCTQHGLSGNLNTLGFTTRTVAGFEAREISFQQVVGETELLGSRVFLPLGSELFVFQLVTSERHIGIERGRFEQVLSSVRFVHPMDQANDGAPSAATSSHDEIYDLEARRELSPWEVDPRGRTALEMRVLLRTLGCVLVIRSRNSEVYRFMRRRCVWVLENLTVDDPNHALEKQCIVFNRALEQLPKDFDLVDRTSMTKATVQRALTRPSGDMHIGTLARIAVALQCPLFGFDTYRSST